MPLGAVKPVVRKPRYMELADELRAEVVRGAFPDGFPTEGALCKRFAVSRFTVREALRSLQGEGLIQRKRGSGTVIRPAAARGGALHQPLSNVGEILQYARDTIFDFTAMGQARIPKVLADAIEPDVSGQWFAFQGLRTRAGAARPIARTDAYVHRDFADIVDKIGAEGTIFRQIEALSGRKVASVTQDIQAVPASAEVAAALGVQRRSPCLRILRCYLDAQGQVFEISASHHPGDSFAYAMHIEVDG